MSNQFDPALRCNRRYAKAANSYSRSGNQSLWAKMMWHLTYQVARARINYPEMF